MKNFISLYNNNSLILTEGSVGLRVANEYGIKTDNLISNAGLIYDATAREVLKKIYGSYLKVAADFSLPILLFTNTRRANKERALASIYKNNHIMSDYADFLRELAVGYNTEVYVGGYIGCKGDGYTGENCLSRAEAEDFHAWQIEESGRADIDLLLASLMSNLEETVGMALSIERSNIPYIVSFAVRENGTIPDGNSIGNAIEVIDAQTRQNPICYMANCIHPKILRNALERNDKHLIKKRFKGIQANAAYLPPEILDKLSKTVTSGPEDLSSEIIRLHNEFPLKICGGCCGTDETHLEAFAKKLTELKYNKTI